MLRIKILDRKNHPFSNKIKVYGISIEAILITFFILIVLFVTAVYIKGPFQKKKPAMEIKLHPL
jgi:hypothetical protein